MLSFFHSQFVQNLCGMLLLGFLVDANIWCMNQAYGEIKEWNFLSKKKKKNIEPLGLRFEALDFSVGTGHFDVGG